MFATPALPFPACVSAGHGTVDPAPSVQTVGEAIVRYWVNSWVVPDPSERCATVIAVLGRVALGLSALIAGSSQVLICREKILAIVSAESCRPFTLDRL